MLQVFAFYSHLSLKIDGSPYEGGGLSSVGIAAVRADRDSELPAAESTHTPSHSANTNDSKTSVITNYSETSLNQLKITLEVGKPLLDILLTIVSLIVLVSVHLFSSDRWISETMMFKIFKFNEAKPAAAVATYPTPTEGHRSCTYLR